MDYFISTVAPASSSWVLIFSASSLLTPSLTGLGASSTSALASFRPEVGDRADFLDDGDLLLARGDEDDVELRLLLPRRLPLRRLRRGPAAIATGAAAVTPELLLEQLDELGDVEDRPRL